MDDNETYWLDTGNDRIYFNAVGGSIVCRGKDTEVRMYEFSHFLAIARELGFKTGKL